MRKALVAVATVLLLVSADNAAVSADSGPPPDPQQELALINQIRAQLGSNLADAVGLEPQLQLRPHRLHSRRDDRVLLLLQHVGHLLGQLR